MAFLCCGIGAALAKDRNVISPTGAFQCGVTPRPEGTGQVVTFKNNKNGKETKLLETDRWAEVVWSPKDEWFAVIDHFDGQGADLSIYEILIAISGEVVGVTKQYQNPSSGAIGVEWSLVGWSVKNGTARIKRAKVMKDSLSIGKHSGEEIYTVPIE